MGSNPCAPCAPPSTSYIPTITATGEAGSASRSAWNSRAAPLRSLLQSPMPPTHKIKRLSHLPQLHLVLLGKLTNRQPQQEVLHAHLPLVRLQRTIIVQQRQHQRVVQPLAQLPHPPADRPRRILEDRGNPPAAH